MLSNIGWYLPIGLDRWGLKQWNELVVYCLFSSVSINSPKLYQPLYKSTRALIVGKKLLVAS